MFDVYYDKKRFSYIHDDLIKSGIINSYTDKELIYKTAVFVGNDINVYIDTSDGVNDDLNLYEYCGRIKKIIKDLQGKRFLLFKSAYSSKWTKNIEKLAIENNGKVIPFFKWSFNENFYNTVFGNAEKIKVENLKISKEYDIGIFFGDKKYHYPKPSESDSLISWSDHKKFGIKGTSKNTGYYPINSRKNLIEKLTPTNFKILHTAVSYDEYIKLSYKCKIIINPPGIGEYTSRMVDQSYLGNCIVLRKNSYDNAFTWKNHIPEIDFNNNEWEINLKNIINNYSQHGKACKEYFDKYWASKSIVNYFIEQINE